jgi:hypothetical protein
MYCVRAAQRDNYHGPISLCHWQHYSHQADCGWDERKEEKKSFFALKTNKSGGNEEIKTEFYFTAFVWWFLHILISYQEIYSPLRTLQKFHVLLLQVITGRRQK